MTRVIKPPAFIKFRAAGAEILREVYDEAYGRVAIFKDPEGRPISLVQLG